MLREETVREVERFFYREVTVFQGGFDNGQR
jgi:hypothetical protein